MFATQPIAISLEAGLDATAFLFLPLLVLLPRGIAPLVSISGALALALVLPNVRMGFRELLRPAGLFMALLIWGTLSAAWSVDPAHSLLVSVHLGGLFAAGLALMAAAEVLVSPRRLLLCLYGGWGVGLLLASVQFASGGVLTRHFLAHGFFASQLNQAADALAILVLPASVTFICRGRAGLGLALALVTLSLICGLVGTAAKAALCAGFVFAGALYFSPRNVARAAAILSVLTILTAPLTFARVARLPAVAEAAEAIKFSAWHRLMIWSFAGDRIAEQPLIGWGLDSSRAIPGGSEPIYQGRVWMPLHPHNAAIQVWLELGAPGAVLFALIIARLWFGLAAASWPRLFAAAAGASLVTGSIAAIGTFGIWQEWWIGTLWFSLFLTLVMARCLPAQTPRPTHLGSPVQKVAACASGAADDSALGPSGL